MMPVRSKRTVNRGESFGSVSYGIPARRHRRPRGFDDRRDAGVPFAVGGPTARRGQSGEPVRVLDDAGASGVDRPQSRDQRSKGGSDPREVRSGCSAGEAVLRDHLGRRQRHLLRLRGGIGRARTRGDVCGRPRRRDCTGGGERLAVRSRDAAGDGRDLRPQHLDRIDRQGPRHPLCGHTRRGRGPERPPSPARLSRRPPSGRRGLPSDGGGAHADDRRILATLPFEVGVPPEGPNGFLALRPIVERAARSHVLGFAVVLGVALLLHYGLLPLLGRRVGIRETPAYFLAVALVPVALWLIPAFSPALARGAYHAHRKLFGKDGVYVRLPASEPIRLHDTRLMSVAPFAIDVLVMAEILFLQGTADLRQLVVGFVAFPILLLAGLLTSLLPGAWLLDGLELRLIRPIHGEVVRPAEWFERTVGPVGAVALLAGFVTLLNAYVGSYERALVDLGLWAVRLFPAVFGAVCVYRLVVEPQVLPSLVAWCANQGIETRTALPDVLAEWAAGSAGDRPRSLS